MFDSYNIIAREISSVFHSIYQTFNYKKDNDIVILLLIFIFNNEGDLGEGNMLNNVNAKIKLYKSINIACCFIAGCRLYYVNEWYIYTTSSTSIVHCVCEMKIINSRVLYYTIKFLSYQL